MLNYVIKISKAKGGWSVAAVLPAYIPGIYIWQNHLIDVLMMKL